MYSVKVASCWISSTQRKRKREWVRERDSMAWIIQRWKCQDSNCSITVGTYVVTSDSYFCDIQRRMPQACTAKRRLENGVATPWRANVVFMQSFYLGVDQQTREPCFTKFPTMQLPSKIPRLLAENSFQT